MLSSHNVEDTKSGTSFHGYPFLIVSKDFAVSPNVTDGFIDINVKPLIQEYAYRLSNGENPQDTMKELYKRIYEDLPDGVQFSMSVGIIYSRGNRLYCAGFGNGETSLVLRKGQSSGEGYSFKQLSYPKRNVDRVFDRFVSFKAKNSRYLDEMIERSIIFDERVELGTEILGYTAINAHLIHSYSDDVVYTEKLKLVEGKLDGTLLSEIDPTSKTGISSVSIEFSEEQRQALFDEAKERFNRLLTNGADINRKGHDVLEKIKKLEKDERNLPELTRYLQICSHALEVKSSENINALLACSKEAQGKPSAKWQALGVAMMIFGVLIGTLSALIIAASLGAFATGVLAPLAAPGIVGGCGLGSLSVMVTSVGVSFFAAGKRRGGLSKASLELVEELKKSQPAPSPLSL